MKKGARVAPFRMSVRRGSGATQAAALTGLARSQASTDSGELAP